MSPDQLHLYAIAVLTLIGMGLVIALIIGMGLLLFVVIEVLVRLYDWIEERREGKTV